MTLFEFILCLMAGLFIFFNVVLFWELVNVRYTKAKEAQVPLFRTIQWAWFVVALFYAYGSSFLKAPMGLKENLKVCANNIFLKLMARVNS